MDESPWVAAFGAGGWAAMFGRGIVFRLVESGVAELRSPEARSWAMRGFSGIADIGLEAWGSRGAAACCCDSGVLFCPARDNRLVKKSADGSCCVVIWGDCIAGDGGCDGGNGAAMGAGGG